MRISEFQRHHAVGGHPDDADAGTTRLSALNPSLMQDLLRFERPHRPADGLDLLEVLAAALRHSRTLLLHLQLDYRVIPLTVLPVARQVQGALAVAQLMELRLTDLRVLRVEPASAAGNAPVRPPEPLAPLLWELALRGARGELLPEISGVATYRVTPGADLAALALAGSLAAAVLRLREQTTPLSEIASWPGFDRDRAARLLNALYLHSALMVSRSHPGAMQGL